MLQNNTNSENIYNIQNTIADSNLISLDINCY